MDRVAGVAGVAGSQAASRSCADACANESVSMSAA